MKPAFKPLSFPIASDSIERLLSWYYPKLVEWSRIIARGDESAADETVQDLCLHLTMARPDFARVENLDNYLFMCLRNMYVSNLARVSRERLRVIHVEDYDALSMAAADGTIDAVDTQNELIRICAYILARKHESKSASHFILHFFCGYRRSDVARLARSPISAVYNGLKEARGELREHLASHDKMHLVRTGAKPDLHLLRAALSTDSFLAHLRTAIFDSDPRHCMESTELVAAYSRPGEAPVACEEFAHLVGCHRCMEVLQRALQLDDRDGPFDGAESADKSHPSPGKSFDAVMRMVHKRRKQSMERRPTLLAIAADGRVAAFHAIESSHNSLSSRLEGASTLRFVEVFDEFGGRLAHIPVEGEYASAPGSRLSQEIFLSDDRRLCLNVTFDGLGIHASVDYTDPALGPNAESRPPVVTPANRRRLWNRLWRPIRFSFAPLALASLMVALLTGVAAYRYTHPALGDVLSRARAAAPTVSKDESLHQILQIEEVTGATQQAKLGTVDVWQSKGTAVRRLYSSGHQLLAVATELPGGTSSVRVEKGAGITTRESELVQSGLWRTDVSAAAFGAGSERRTEAMRSWSGYELTQSEQGNNGVQTRILVLDRQYHVRSETIRYATGSRMHEVRLVQTLLGMVSNRNLPPETFPHAQQSTPQTSQGEGALAVGWDGASAEDANLEVAVLYVLFQLNADVGQPIEVAPVSDGRIRVDGTIADPRQLATIRGKLNALNEDHRLEVHIVSAAQAAAERHLKWSHQQELEAASNDAPAAQLVRTALLARGLKGAALQSAEEHFDASALAHAQIGLQHAYALDRLGAILRRYGSQQLNPNARAEWSQMVASHAAAATAELASLGHQLHTIAPDVADASPAEDSAIDIGINDPSSFVRAAAALRAKAQSLNEQVVELFAGSKGDLSVAQARAAAGRLRAQLPVAEATRMQTFASRLAHSSGHNELGEIRPK